MKQCLKIFLMLLIFSYLKVHNFYFFIPRLMQKQLAYMLGRQQTYMELDENTPELDELKDIMSNTHLNTNFLVLGREVGSTIFIFFFLFFCNKYNKSGLINFYPS